MRYIPPIMTDRLSPTQANRLEEPDVPLEDDYEQSFDFEGEKYQFTLALGGLAFRMRTDDAGIAEHFETGFGDFLCSDEPVVTMDLKRSESFPFHTLTGKLMMYRDGDILASKFRNMATMVRASGRIAKGWMTGDNYRQDLSNMIRFCVAGVLPGLDALLFHTAAIAHEGKAYLFYGPATAGKSTVMNLSRDRTVMTDDMLILRQDTTGLVAATCGFWGGETRDILSKRYEFPVAGFFRLHKDISNFVKPLKKPMAAFELVSNIPGVERTAEEHTHVLDLAVAAARSARTYELHFHKRDASFWRCLDELD